MMAAYHNTTSKCITNVSPRNGATPISVRDAGFSLANVERSENGNVVQNKLRGELWMFLTNSQPGTAWWEFGFAPHEARRKQPWDADTRRELLSWKERADAYWQIKGVPSPVRDDFTRFTLPEYMSERGFIAADIDNQWMNPGLARDLGFDQDDLWPSLRNLVVPGLDEAIASAESFAVAIDCLPVGKDIRNRLQAHVRAHIDLLRSCAGDAA